MESEEMRGRDIPMELVIEILVHLPLKPLLRFTCVSKTWLYLIRNDRGFVMRHYLQKRVSSLSMDNLDYVVTYSDYPRASPPSTLADEVTKVCLLELTEKKTFRMVKKFDIGPGLFESRSNFCHGIMCVQVYPCYQRPRRNPVVMFLCNLAFGEVLRLPSLNGNVENVGIGYDSTHDDYKIVGISWHYNPYRCQVDVYSVRNGCWRSVCSSDMAILNQYNGRFGYAVLNANERILNLVPQRVEKSIVDMVDEVFWEALMPECGRRPHVSHKLLHSFRWYACVCCFPATCHNRNEPIDIWVVDGRDKLWFKWVSIRLPEQVVYSSMNCIWMNDRELFVHVIREDLTEVFHYDLYTQQLKPTGRKGTLDYAKGYRVSLISIKGLMSTCSDTKQDGEIKEDETHQHHSTQDKTNNYERVYFIRELTRRKGISRSFTFKIEPQA